MARRWPGPARWRGAALVLALVLPLPALAGGARLEVVTDDGRILARLPLQAGERWCVLWEHSVAGFTVRDCYTYRDGRMVLVASHQPDFAAGLGHVPGRGVQRSDGNGGYWIRGIDEPVPGDRYRLRVGSERVNHRIRHRDRVTSLSAQAAGEAVTLRLREGGG
ncbi:DUF1850 domain-containing protein [Sediminicurvatus halobius]|uniref:DUF1850 domain-containing protein n=1 Tax=Sediminicurvatus halobius TaxID=2182432 RepID=A0A2U2N004_9GAMM|nr:DUF1850 domain-containing protein [Spiribacter halobius]PWG62516.1 DUF1850 domain-containing protein [Spiribacter halobius]UEX78611.1 DUF1850 domain-containing protein [Spiribacter halobius]